MFSQEQRGDGLNNSEVEFEKGSWFSKACFGLRQTFRTIAGCIALLNSVLDILYAYTTVYVLEGIFILTCVFLLVKLVVMIILGQCYYTKYVRNIKQGLGKQGMSAADGDDGTNVDERGRSDSRKQVEFVNQGQNLYASLHLLFYTGLFRMMPALDFEYELGFGYSTEVLVSIFPMFIF